MNIVKLCMIFFLLGNVFVNGSAINQMSDCFFSMVSNISANSAFGYCYTALFFVAEYVGELMQPDFFLHTDNTVLHTSINKNAHIVSDARRHTRCLWAIATLGFIFFEYHYYANKNIKARFFENKLRTFGEALFLQQLITRMTL